MASPRFISASFLVLPKLEISTFKHWETKYFPSFQTIFCKLNFLMVLLYHILSQCNLDSILLFLERNSQIFKKSQAFGFSLDRRNNGDRKTKNIFDVFVRGFRENSVFFNANRQVTDIVHRSATNAAEVLGARQGNVNQLFQKSIRPFAAECDQRANRISLTNLERRNGLLGPAQSRFLAGDFRQAFCDGVVFFAILLHRGAG